MNQGRQKIDRNGQANNRPMDSVLTPLRMLEIPGALLSLAIAIVWNDGWQPGPKTFAK